MKYKVGKKYKVTLDSARNGNIIEITSVETSFFTYKTLMGKDYSSCVADIDSIFAKSLVPVNECIVIYRKDNKVIALDKTNGKTGVARCNPIDEFDFNVGANIAFARLMKPEQQEELKKVTANDELAMTLKVLIESLEKQGFSRKESITIAVGIATGVAKGGN